MRPIVTRSIRGVRLLFLPAVILLMTSPASGRDDMSGEWKEDYTETVYSVEQWGPHCGDAPRSTGKQKRNLTFTVEDRGVDLLFKTSSGASFSTAACQSKSKGLIAKERNLKDKLFLVNCATPETAQSYESGLYSFRIKSNDRIEYRETSRFSRNIKGALCVHTRRVRRVYSKTKAKVTNETSKPDAGVPAPVTDRKVSDPQEDPCEKPGAAVRLQLVPDQAVVKPGDTFCPESMAFDERECKADSTLSWGKGKVPSHVKLTTSGCLKISPKAKAGIVQVPLAAGKAQAGVTLEVKRKPVSAHLPVEKPDAGSQPSDPGPADAGATRDADQPPAETKPEVHDAGMAEATGAELAAPPPPSSGEQGLPTWVLPAAIGGGALLLVVIVLVVLSRRKRGTSPADSPPVTRETIPEPLRPVPAPAEEAPTTSPDEPDRVFCTTCGKAIPAEAKFCPYDRTQVYKPASPTLASAPVCPTCHRLLPAGAKFCPYDRTKLE